ncbi:MAG: type II toxin-antitoxin system VapC family toxin [Candidatus Omnitrophota bacterium]
MKPIFVDTNIFIYASGNPHPHKEPSVGILERIAKNQLKAVINSEVLQEILHRYYAINDRERGFSIFDDCIKIIPIILPITKQDIIKAREILQAYSSLEARDATHAAVMLNRGITALYSYDKHFDQIKGIKRLQP